MRLYSIIFFTDDYESYCAFQKDCEKSIKKAYNKGTLVTILDSFYVNEKDKYSHIPLFSSSRDLMLFFERYSANMSDLVVLIDCNCSIITKELGFAENFRSIIIEYPDVKFLFSSDPCWVLFEKEEVEEDILKADINICNQCLQELRSCSEKGEIKAKFIRQINEESNGEEAYWTFLRTLCGAKNDERLRTKIREVRKRLCRRLALNHVWFNYLVFPEKNDDFLLNIIHSHDNLFDASNIRYAIKQWKYAELDVHAINFESVQKSRRDNLAVCVEEENGQNRFNSYCMFANGFRVLPITCASELIELNSQADTIKPTIIIRDYDLQFFDSTVARNVKYQQDSDSIKAIRGFRDNLKGVWSIHVFDSPCWSSFYKDYQEVSGPIKLLDKIPKSASQISVSKKNTNPIPIYFISKGVWNVSVSSPAIFLRNKKSLKTCENMRCSHYVNEIKNVKKLFIPGLEKPLSGIYEPFHCIPEIKKRYFESRCLKSYFINTSREDHAHGTPLDIYDIIKSLISRAEKYFKMGKYVHASILSNEAIEYLNGFHQSLMVEAYYINAISENALAMDAMVDEKSLSKDTDFRVEKIRSDIERIYAQWGRPQKHTIKMAVNTLNQIYSDCRNFCRDKEHFGSESVFIGSMARLNEGSLLSKYFGL